MGTHIDEEFYNINDLIADTRDNYLDEGVRKDVKDFLSKFYAWNDECEEFDETPKDNYRKYEIKVKHEDECCDDDYITIIYVSVELPSDDDAKELADLIDGKVTSGLNADGKTFCITYRKKICIKAKNRKEAKKLFDAMNIQSADRDSDFIDVSTIVEVKEK